MGMAEEMIRVRLLPFVSNSLPASIFVICLPKCSDA